MKIIALELTTSQGSVALMDGSCVVRSLQWPNDRCDSAPFFRALQSIVHDFGSVDTIAVGLGPGSYAGARIAISAAAGLQLAWEARLVGYSSLCAFEVEMPEYWAVGDARRESYFVARIRDSKSVEGPSLCTRSELETRLTMMAAAAPIFSSEALTLPVPIAIAYPTAERLARITARGAPGAVAPPLEPLYLRDPYITLPRTPVTR